MAEWELAGFSASANAFVDVDTITKNGDLIKVWIMYSDTEVDSTKNFRSLRSLQEIKCKNREYRILYESRHSGEIGGGQTVFAKNINEQNWTPIAPDSVAESIRKFACKK